MLTCPHCRKQNKYAYADEFKRVAVGRFICSHCRKEFFVLDNEPMTKEQYRSKIKAKRKHARAG